MIKNVKTDMQRMNDLSFNMLSSYRKSLNESAITEDRAIAQCILQMIICKNSSMLSLSEGILIVANNEDYKIIDPTSIFAILRSLYETIFIFRNIFIMPDTDEERRILCNLWKIRGLYNRQECKVSLPEHKRIQNNEKQRIRKLQEEIREIVKGLQIDSKAKHQIESVISEKTSMLKGYMFSKKSNGVIEAFKTISFTASSSYFGKSKQQKILYGFLSSKSHPSYLGLMQFGQMYHGSDCLEDLHIVLKSSCIYTAIFLSDFCKFDNVFKSQFNSLSKEDKELIFRYSILFDGVNK